MWNETRPACAAQARLRPPAAGRQLLFADCQKSRFSEHRFGLDVDVSASRGAEQECDGN